MEDEIMSGLSEDMSKFTKIVEGEQEVQEEQEAQEQDEESFFDMSSIPEDQREAFSETFEKMQSAYKSKTTGLDALQHKTEVVDALINKLNETTPTQKATQETVVEPKEKGLDFEFEDGDYYEKPFQQVTDMVKDLKAEMSKMQTSSETKTQSDFKTKVTGFFNDNKVDNKVIAQMDAIAGELGNQAYNNLPRLLNLAKMELGIDLKPKTTPKPNPRSRVEHKTMRKAVQHKEPNSMAEAWAQAEDQLSQ